MFHEPEPGLAPGDIAAYTAASGRKICFLVALGRSWQAFFGRLVVYTACAPEGPNGREIFCNFFCVSAGSPRDVAGICEEEVPCELQLTGIKGLEDALVGYPQHIHFSVPAKHHGLLIVLLAQAEQFLIAH